MKHYVTALLLLLDPATCANPFRTAPRKPPSKACKTAKNNKGLECAQDADLVARYGPQLCPNQVAAEFDQLDMTSIRISAGGINHFLQPTYSSPVSDFFATNGQVALTFEQTVSVCVTRCQNDPGCDAVEVKEKKADNPKYPTGKPDFECLMINTGLGPGAYLSPHDPKGGEPCPCMVQHTIFLKLPSKVPYFEDVQCNIDGRGTALQAGVGCTVGQITDPVICGALLTDDWNQYVAPAIGCLAQNGGGDALEACMGCLNAQTPNNTSSDICPDSTADATTMFRDPQKCATACLGAMCEMLLQKMMLCVTGAPLQYEEGAGYGGGVINRNLINGPDFMCPSVE